VISPDITALLNQHRSLAQGRWLRWPWQADPNDFLNDIDHLAALLCEGDASSADDLTNDLKNARDQLGADAADTGFDMAKRDIRHWRGHAADNFATYLSNTQGAVHHYRDVLHDFTQLTAGLTGMLAEIPKNVRDIVQRAIEAQQQQESQMGWEVVLTLAAAIPAAIASVATAGTVPVWIILGLSTASLAGSEVNVLISNDGPGETAQSLRDGLRKLLDEVVDRRENFNGAVMELWEYISEANFKGHLKDVEPDSPEIVTKPRFQPGDFFPDDTPPGVQDGVDTSPLVKPDQPQPESKVTTTLAGG
jgi:hypothetical protein